MRISDWSSDVCSSDLKNRRSQLRRPRVQIQKLLRRSIATLATPSMPGRITACRSPASSASTRKRFWPSTLEVDRKSVVEGKSVSVRVDLGGRRILKKKNTPIHRITTTNIHLNK